MLYTYQEFTPISAASGLVTTIPKLIKIREIHQKIYTISVFPIHTIFKSGAVGYSSYGQKIKGHLPLHWLHTIFDEHGTKDTVWGKYPETHSDLIPYCMGKTTPNKNYKLKFFVFFYVDFLGSPGRYRHQPGTVRSLDYSSHKFDPSQHLPCRASIHGI